MKKAVSIKNKKRISFFIIILIIISIFLNSISGTFTLSDFALAENTQNLQKNQTPDLIITNDITLTQRSTYEILDTIENPDIPDRTYNEYSIKGETSPLDYPKYNQYSSNNKNQNNLNAVLEESKKICNYNNTYYDTITDDKKLLLNGVEVGTFYKHDAAIDNYGGNVSDSEPRLKVKLQINPREHGNVITGLYAPAGELIKVTIPEYMVNKGIKITIGSITQRNNPTDINYLGTSDAAKYRMPCLFNISPELTQTVTNVGNMLGGPIYISGGDEPFEVIVEGAVLYNHFIYGTTTEEQYNQTLSSTAPYFDFEAEFNCYNNLGIRASMPLSFKNSSTENMTSSNLMYENLTDVAEFWSYAFSVTAAFPDTGNENVKNALFDPYIRTGSAYAFRGGDYLVLPLISTIYGKVTFHATYILDSVRLYQHGIWAIFHELHHLFQQTDGLTWGASNWTESTNNSLTAALYTMVTDVSGIRTENYSDLESWSWIASNYYTLYRLYMMKTPSVVNPTSSNDIMAAVYATIMHSFGVDTFIKIINYSLALTPSDENFYKAVCEITGYNMEYFLVDEIKFSVSESVIEQYRSFPIYIPVFNVYGSGHILNEYNSDNGTYFPTAIETTRPFAIPYGQTKKLDLNAYFYTLSKTTVNVINVETPKYGTIVENSDGTYNYTPDTNHITESFNVTVELVTEGYDTVTTEVILSFKQNNPDGSYRYTFTPETYLEKTYYTNQIRSNLIDVSVVYSENYDLYTPSIPNPSFATDFKILFDGR